MDKLVIFYGPPKNSIHYFSFVVFDNHFYSLHQHVLPFNPTINTPYPTSVHPTYPTIEGIKRLPISFDFHNSDLPMKRQFDAGVSDCADELKKMKRQVLESEEEKKLPMKRQFDAGEANCSTTSAGDGDGDGDLKKKLKMKHVIESPSEEGEEAEAVLLDENLLYEVLKHVDGRTLATAACVSKQWNQTALDERLWELICTKHNRNQQQQLRAVVLALGGFRRLYSLYLWPLSKPSPSPSPSTPPASAWPCLPPPPTRPLKYAATNTRWGKDEVNLSLSLLSIRYYEKMNFKANKST